MTGAGTLGRARGALRSIDFRRLLAIRLMGQCGDGLFLSVLTASTVFDTRGRQTTTGFFLNTLIISLPFTVLGPFVGVFIDRWSRRRILCVAPILKAAAAGLVLFDPVRWSIPFFAGALFVISVNRFFLATANAVVPRVVPIEDLLAANALATVGGTLALLVGVFAGGLVSEALGNVPIVAVCAITWVFTAGIARTFVAGLGPHLLRPPPPIVGELDRVLGELADGVGHLVRTPRALGPITSITLDQFGQGVLTVLSLVVFREQFKEGVGSFSYLVGAGGIGVLLGIATVGTLEHRFGKERLISLAFVAGGVSVLLVAMHITGLTVLYASFAVGLTFAWKKIPVDTMVQESLPDAYRGRVFSAYDVAYNLARIVAAGLAIPLLPRVGVPWSVAAIGVGFLLWSPVLPRWLRRAPEIVMRFREGARAEEWPRAIVWGGVEEAVEVRRSWLEERDGERRRCFRLELQDGSVLDVSSPEPAGPWRLDAERS
ncbi:MAG: MFS transporter [Actinobacteria bacterium]|nr:MFS transporter [Actinomycetota bacterium]